MSRHPLGSTGLRVSSIGLGLAALGRPGYINLGHAEDLGDDRSVARLEARTRKVLNAAWDAGVRYFDVARSYGRGEAFLGRWLQDRELDPRDVVVGSKWGYTYTADWQVDADVHEVKDHSLATFERQWPKTRDNLHPHLDLYQIHSATLQTGVLDDADVHRALAGLKEHDVAVGLSLSGSRQAETLERALEVEVDGVPLFDTVQATWNLLEPSAGPVLQAAREDGRGVIVKEALANGRLTPRGTNLDESPDAPHAGDAHAVLRAQADRLGTTVDALAIAAAVHQPWADVVLSGAARTDHLRSNLRALDVDWDEEAADALSSLAESPDTYWSLRDQLAWT
jgi:aryl-alcohol dehydrogenase-like predicted oxidoreductase